MIVIVQLSDTHFGTEVSDVVTAAKQAVLAIKPDVIILSGDITQRARPSQFRAARDFMDALPAAKKIIIPGNHDIPLYAVWTRFSLPYRHYCRTFGSRESVWYNDEIAIVALDATSPYRHTRGKLSPAQLLRRFAQVPDDGKKRLLVVCAHQPLQTAWPEDNEERLIDADETAQYLAQHQADIVLSGHVHVPLITTTHDAFPSLPRHFILAGAGTAVSHRVRPGAPNQFNVIRGSYEGGIKSVTVDSFVYDQDMREFVVQASYSFRQEHGNWKLM